MQIAARKRLLLHRQKKKLLLVRIQEVLKIKNKNEQKEQKKIQKKEDLRKKNEQKEQLESEIRNKINFIMVRASTLFRKRRIATLYPSICVPLPDRLRGD